MQQNAQPIGQHRCHQGDEQDEREKDGVNEVEAFKAQVHKVGGNQPCLHQSDGGVKDGRQRRRQVHQVNEVKPKT